ncbi:transglutaminase domain-containing protein [Acidaminobacter sp. JC074]|uniref:transglutaminase-like domain-containing protein n=1 Tax=Acidaminobacter sp. JC074 TaxID=2530199 RepID=UPI001F0F06ED|nr:transglutaminase-like domain-containing protein [Acidaminobacter sp. JC074]MCH4891359.1 transglutaminase domain-containing protein [Acidaminobacter sp. JC074]
MIKRYFNVLEPKAIYFIGFLLSFPLALIATNSIPTRMEFEQLFLIGIIVWTVLYFIKPIKSHLFHGFIVIQFMWIYGLGRVLSPFMQEGFETIFPGGLSTANFIHENLGGKFFSEFIFFIRDFFLENLEVIDEFYFNLFNVLIFAFFMALVMRLVESRVNWKYFLVAGFYFVIAWFIYVSSLKGYFTLYFIGLTVYKQFRIYETQVNNAKGLGERTRYYNYSSAIVVGTVIMVVVILVSNVVQYIMPTETLNETIHTYIPNIATIRNDFKKLGQTKIFSFSSTIYAPNGNMLGGPIIDRDYDLIMRVKADHGSMYLRGRTKNVYDGSQWLTDFDTYSNNIYRGVVIPEEHLEEMIIYPESIITRTVFSPYKYYSSSFTIDRIYGNDDSIVYRKASNRIKTERYSVEYINPEYVGEYDLLDEEKRELYMAYPSVGLNQTESLTRRLLSGIDDPYEKMKTLERYLRDNHRYTLSTRAVDTSEDFVENFLFDEKEGYCTYFATSLAIMGRMADIPTRYVEGFLTNDFEDADGLYEVGSNRAHAWVEAYIEGMGWVQFEPTPAYLNGDEVEETDDTFIPSENESAPSTEDIDDRMREEILEEGGVIATEDTISLGDIMTVIFYLVCFIGLFLLVVLKAKRLRKDIHDGDDTEKINRRIHYVLSMCRIIDDDIDPSTLPKQVILKNAQTIQVDVDSHVLQMIDQSLYSDKVFSQEEFEEFNRFFELFEFRLKKRITFIGHMMHKYLMNSLYHRDYYI